MIIIIIIIIIISGARDVPQVGDAVAVPFTQPASLLAGQGVLYYRIV